MPFVKDDPNINRLGRPHGSKNHMTKMMQNLASDILETINLHSLDDRDKIRLLDVLLRHGAGNKTAIMMPMTENFSIKELITFDQI